MKYRIIYEVYYTYNLAVYIYRKREYDAMTSTIRRELDESELLTLRGFVRYTT